MGQRFSVGNLESTSLLCSMSLLCSFLLHTCVARLDCIFSPPVCMVYLYFVCMFINILICILICTFFCMFIWMISVLLSCASCHSVSLSVCFSYLYWFFRKLSFGSRHILVLWILRMGFFWPSLLFVHPCYQDFPWLGFPSVFCPLKPAEVLQVCLL